MSKMKKFLSLALVASMTAGIAASGTLAYLTSQDSGDAPNVMVLGNVEIEQHEYERADADKDGKYDITEIDGVDSYVLTGFTQGKPLLPIVGDPSESGNSPAYAGYDSTTVRMTQVGSYGGMDVFAGKNAQDKFVTVENTGKTDAYVRTLVAIEVGSTEDKGKLVKSSYHFTWSENFIGYITVDEGETYENNYKLYEYVYNGWNDGDRHVNGILPAGDTSYPNLSQLYLKHTATNEYCEELDGNNNGTLDIFVLSQAVQAAGFELPTSTYSDDKVSVAKYALDIAWGKPEEINPETGKVNAVEWLESMGNNLQYVAVESENVTIEGEEAVAILADLTRGKNLIFDEDVDEIVFDTNEVDAQGATVTMNGQGPEAYGYLSFTPDAGENVTLSNLNVTGSGFVEVGAYGQGNGTYVLNNVKIEDLASTLKNGDKGFNLACAFMHFGNATLNNCTMTGTTAIQEGAMPVDLACANGFTTVVNGGEYGTIYCWSNGWTTINGAEVDTMYVAPIKGSVTIKAGSSIDNLIIDYGIYAEKYADGSKLSQLVIEEGATVNKITFNGTTYTLTEWNAR